MPLYKFECPGGHITRNFYSFSAIAKIVRCKQCNRRARRILGVFVAPAGNFPMTSSAAGVYPSQIEEAERRSREPGMVPIEFSRKTETQGDAIFTDRKHRKKYCESIGLHDLDGGVGDPMPLGTGN